MCRAGPLPSGAGGHEAHDDHSDSSSISSTGASASGSAEMDAAVKALSACEREVVIVSSATEKLRDVLKLHELPRDARPQPGLDGITEGESEVSGPPSRTGSEVELPSYGAGGSDRTSDRDRRDSDDLDEGAMATLMEAAPSQETLPADRDADVVAAS